MNTCVLLQHVNFEIILVVSFNTHGDIAMTGTLRPLDVVMLPDGRMDAKNAATYCGLSVKTLAMKRCDGNGPKFVKLGRVFYFRDDLDEWLRGNRATSTAQVRQTT